MDVPVYVVFDYESRGSAAIKEGSQCIEMTQPR
jgi:hypothetical protein